MNRPMVRILLLTGALITCSLLRADTIGMTFLSSTLTGTPGSTLTFQGSVTNNSGGDVFINGAGITLASFGPSDSDITDFIINATGLLIDGSSVGPTDLFTVTIPDEFATGQYAGIFSVQGGRTLNDDIVLATANLQVNVSSVPEPRSFFLMISALLVAFFFHFLYADGLRTSLNPTPPGESVCVGLIRSVCVGPLITIAPQAEQFLLSVLGTTGKLWSDARTLIGGSAAPHLVV